MPATWRPSGLCFGWGRCCTWASLPSWDWEDTNLSCLIPETASAGKPEGSQCSLFEQACSLDNLLGSWLKIKEKGSIGGADKVTLGQFEANLDKNLADLSQQLQAGRYIPEPYQELSIPKKDGQVRVLGLPAVRDKIAQEAVRSLIEPILDRTFLPSSYGYRLRKGPVMAIHWVRHLIQDKGCKWVVLCDIDSYFDRIDHAFLFQFVRKLLPDDRLVSLLELWVRMGSVGRSLAWKDRPQGIPQGSVISPLLSNLYLHPLDEFMWKQHQMYVRYADDFVVLNRTEASCAKVLVRIESFLQTTLHLNLNPEKQVLSLEKGFEFLGLFFQGAKILLSPEKTEGLQKKIVDAFPKEPGYSFQPLLETLLGIGRYYGQLLPQPILEEFDCWVWDRLSQLVVKRPRSVAPKAELAQSLRTLPFLSRSFRLDQRRRIKRLLNPRSSAEKTIPGIAKTKEQPVVPAKRAPNLLIQTKKRKYQRLQAAGSELLIAKPGLALGRNKGGIVVREKGAIVHDVPIALLKGITVVAPGIGISSSALQCCAEHGVSIDFFGSDGKPYAKLFSFKAPSFSLSQAQVQAITNGRGAKLARAFVRGKIQNQINLVKYFQKYRKEREPGYPETIGKELHSMENLLLGLRDLQEKPLEELRGLLLSIEGRAASSYWQCVSCLFSDNMEFPGRIRQGATDLVNSLLNYGYGILYSKVWQAVLRAGLNPNISYIHVPRENDPTLVFDMVEEFRPQAVDRHVFSLVSKGKELTMEDGKLSLLTKKRLTERILTRIHLPMLCRGQRIPLIDWMNEQAVAVGRFLEGRIESYQPFVAQW